MKKLLLLILLFPLYVFATDHILGTGSGTVAQNGMTGYAPGDNIFIVSGTYTSMSFTGLIGITIRPQSGTHTVFCTGTITMNNNSGVDYSLISSIGVAGNAYNISGGNNQNCSWRNLYLQNISGSGWQFGVNRVYSWGVNSTTQMFQCNFDSIYVSGIGQFFTGAFASITASGGPYDVVDSINLTNVYMEGVTNQDQIVGVYVHAKFDNIKSVLPNQGTPVTDKGFMQCGDGSGGWGNFQGSVSRIYINGGRGKIGRFHCITWHTGTRDSTIFSNCGKFNTSNYGGIDIYNSVANGTVAGHTTGASVMIENITCGNMTTVNAFPTAIVFVGPMNAGTLTIRNTLTFSNVIDGNGNIYNSSGGSWIPVDTLRNFRFANSTTADLDATGTFATYKPFTTSPVVGLGIRVNLLTDYAGIAYSNPPVVGYLMASGTPPPPPPPPPSCNCLPRHKGFVQLYIPSS